MLPQQKDYSYDMNLRFREIPKWSEIDKKNQIIHTLSKSDKNNIWKWRINLKTVWAIAFRVPKESTFI